MNFCTYVRMHGVASAICESFIHELLYFIQFAKVPLTKATVFLNKSRITLYTYLANCNLSFNFYTHTCTVVPLLKDPSHKRPPPVTDHYSSPSIERPLPQKTTSSYRPLLPCTDALTVHTIKPPLEDHLFSETKVCWI